MPQQTSSNAESYYLERTTDMTKLDTIFSYSGIPFVAILLTIACPEWWLLWAIGALAGTAKVWTD